MGGARGGGRKCPVASHHGDTALEPGHFLFEGRSMNQVNVGIIGFGTVGSGTVQILIENRDLITSRVGSEIVIRKIADLDLDTDRGIPLDRSLLTKDAMEIINDPQIDIVVELIGGLRQAKDYILLALEKGKHVVTANKALLAEHGKEVYSAAERQGVSLAFEASVGGGIPVIRSLREGLSANRIRTIMGILNGTSNYILTRMSQKGLPYDQAVQEAIQLGYAEDPPTLDVNGTDAAHKLAILISIAFGVPVPFRSIYREGIDRLTPDDLRYASEFGYCIKLLAVARKAGDSVEARVHPTMVALDHIMANVNGVYNAIYLEGDFVGAWRNLHSTHRRPPLFLLLQVFCRGPSRGSLKDLGGPRRKRYQHLFGDSERKGTGRFCPGGHADSRGKGEQR